MGTERLAAARVAGGRGAGLALLIAVLAPACSSSLRPELSKVRTLAKVERLPALPAGDAEIGASDDASALLDKPLDADAAVRVALLNNRELRARLRELGIRRGQLLQAGLIGNPAFEAEVSPERNTRLELRVEYDVMSLVMAPLRKRAAEHELQAARYAAAAEVVQLGYDVRSHFYALQAAAQRLAVAQRSLDALAAARDAASALLEAGNVPPLEASLQISAYERARIVVAKLELELLERREQVQRLLGLFGKATEWTLAGQLAPVPDELAEVENLERRTLEVNLDLRATEQRLEALARQTGIARTEGWLPHLDADVHALYGDPERASEPRVRWGGGVGLELPVFDHNQGTRRAREAEFDSWLERYQGLAIDLRSAAREARNRLTSAHARARQYQRVIVPAQSRVMEHTLLQYNAMQLGVFQLLEARRAQLEVELDYAETLREYWSASAELNALLSGRQVSSAPSARASGMMTTGAEQGVH
jgi:cobalt-zinc-cadmium efflux system outer membrane protein